MFQNYCRAIKKDKLKVNAETFLKPNRFVWPKPKPKPNAVYCCTYINKNKKKNQAKKIQTNIKV